MKILLVKPYLELLVARRLQEGFLHLEPLELEIVAAGVPDDDHVEILDLSIEKQPINTFIKQIKKINPDLVGFSGYSSNFDVVKKLAQLVKKENPKILTLVGGIHATLLPESYATDSIDLIARGEGAIILKEIIERFKQKKELFFDPYLLSPKDPAFKTKALQKPPPYPQIDDIPLPRRDLVQRKKYFCVWSASETKKLKNAFPQVASLRTSLGCAFSCSFCVIPYLMHHKYLQRSPEEVVNEIDNISEDYIYFVDDEMFLNASRTKDIANLLIERGIKKRYISWARSDTIVKNIELFKLWKKAGLDILYVGLESCDNKRLAEYKKKITADINHQAVEILRETGITLHAAFIVHPDFTYQDFKNLEKEVLSICPAEVTFTVFSPSPATALWDDYKDKFICDPYKFYDCMHSIVPTQLPLKLFYAHFSRLTSLALRANPLRMNKIRLKFRDLLRAIIGGTKYIISLRMIYKDYAS